MKFWKKKSTNNNKAAFDNNIENSSEIESVENMNSPKDSPAEDNNLSENSFDKNNKNNLNRQETPSEKDLDDGLDDISGAMAAAMIQAAAETRDDDEEEGPRGYRLLNSPLPPRSVTVASLILAVILGGAVVGYWELSAPGIKPPAAIVEAWPKTEWPITDADFNKKDTHRYCLWVRSTSSLPQRMKLYAIQKPRGFESGYSVQIIRGKLPKEEGQKGSCKGFKPDNKSFLGMGPGIVFQDYMNRFSSNPQEALIDPLPNKPGVWKPGETHAYQVTLYRKENKKPIRDFRFKLMAEPREPQEPGLFIPLLAPQAPMPAITPPGGNSSCQNIDLPRRGPAQSPSWLTASLGVMHTRDRMPWALAGVDTHSHKNGEVQLVFKVRPWLIDKNAERPVSGFVRANNGRSYQFTKSKTALYTKEEAPTKSGKGIATKITRKPNNILIIEMPIQDLRAGINNILIQLTSSLGQTAKTNFAPEFKVADKGVCMLLQDYAKKFTPIN